MKVNQFRMDEQGLQRFFGPLEAKIMSVIWEKKDCTIRQVREIINLKNPISFNAVMTVMNRLVNKGHLKKKRSGRTVFFQPEQTLDQFLHEQTEAVTRGLILDFSDLVVSHFVDALEDIDPESIEKLKKKLIEKEKK